MFPVSLYLQSRALLNCCEEKRRARVALGRDRRLGPRSSICGFGALQRVWMLGRQDAFNDSDVAGLAEYGSCPFPA